MNPRLIHPVPVKYKNPDMTLTGWDDVLGEPTGDVTWKAEATVNGQVKIYSTTRVEATVAGFEQRGDGYVLMLIEDAVNVEKNAIITSLGGQACEYSVREKQNVVHYGTPRMVRVYFESKVKGSV